GLPERDTTLWQSSFRRICSPELLVIQNLGVPVGVSVEPGSICGMHIDTAVAAIEIGKIGTTSISMGKLGARPKGLTPPGIVEEETAPVIENAILNRRRRIVVGRTGRISRFELSW